MTQTQKNIISLSLIHIWSIKSTTKAQDGLYQYDVVRRLYDSELGNEGVEDVKRYIKLGKIGEAFTSEDQCCLLYTSMQGTRAFFFKGYRSHFYKCFRINH